MTAPFVLPIDQVTRPLDLRSTLACGQCFRWRLEEGGAWNGVLGRDLVRLSMGEDGLVIESSASAMTAAEVAESIAAYLRLDDDLPRLRSALGSDLHLRDAIHPVVDIEHPTYLEDGGTTVGYVR